MSLRCALLCVALVALGLSSAVTQAAETFVFGPGPHPPVFGSGEGSIHILDGTEIISPSRSGPPNTFVVVRDAVEILGGADVRIDGGYFRGGDANYFGPYNSVATVAAGEAFHLQQAVGVIYAGEFIGGEANSTSRLALARGGRGADIVESQLTLYGGTFVGGIGTYPGLPSQNPNVRQEPAISITPGSHVFMYGGETNGVIEIHPQGALSIFGSNLKYEGSVLSGFYLDGTPFEHQVPRFGGTVLLNSTVPEPATWGVAVAMAAVVWGVRRKVGRRCCSPA